MWVNLLCNDYTGGRPDGVTYDGIPPFHARGPLHAEPLLLRARGRDDPPRRQAQDRSLPRSDRDRRLARDPAQQRHRQGLRLRALSGAALPRFPNIVWFNGNDFQSWPTERRRARCMAVAKGIRSTEPDSCRPSSSTSSRALADDTRWRGIIGLDAAYTYSPTYAEGPKGVRSPRPYPGLHGRGQLRGRALVHRPARRLRRQEYWTTPERSDRAALWQQVHLAVLGRWPRYVDTVGSRQMTLVTNLFSRARGLTWCLTAPTGSWSRASARTGTAVRSTTATTSPRRALGTADWRSPTSRAGHPLAVDLKRMAGRRVRAQWYDPTTGKYATVAGSPFARSFRRRFTPPGKNNDGDTDWVLVLTAASASVRVAADR